MLNKFASWMIQSPWFKKYASFLGGVATGMWIMATYWRQIADTLKIWDIERATFLKTLLLVAGAAGISVSIGLSLAKSSREKKP